MMENNIVWPGGLAVFHDALITCNVKMIRDDGRVTAGVQQIKVVLLLDTDEEWLAARDNIRKQIEAFNNAGSD